MKKHIPAILLGIACAILAAAYIKSNQTIHELQNELLQLKSQPEQGGAVAEAGMSVPDISGGEQPEQTASLTPAEAPEKEEPASGRRMMENIAKMMDNPTMNKVMEAQQRGTVGALYADMLEYLNLNKEETQYFMDLLMYRQMKQVDMAMKMMGGQLSDEEKEALGKEVEEAQNIFEEEMKKFLNSEEDYNEFEYYEKTMGERMMLSQMDKDLSGTDSALSDATYRELLGIMHDERENFDFNSNLNDQENMDMSAERFSKDNVQNYANDVQNLNDAICQKAQSILTPEQYDAFVASLKTFTDMQLAQLEMAAQMFGGGE